MFFKNDSSNSSSDFKFRIAQFAKVSLSRFITDWLNTFYLEGRPEEIERIKEIYNKIELPIRKTTMSAGYDFSCPETFNIKEGESVNIPTGIRCYMDYGWVLCEFPRSGMGFKYGIHMANTVGIIDGDYVNSDNEGHIFIKVVNDSSLAKDITIEQGDGFCQGIFLPYGITVDDNVTEIRNGGFGSTDKK